MTDRAISTISIALEKVKVERMPLDPQAQSLLDLLASMDAPPLHEQSVEFARQSFSMLQNMSGPLEEVNKIEDRTIPGPVGEIPIRIYTPEGNGPFPVLVFFHGGGWVIGSIETYDPVCRSLTNAGQCIVVSVEYRLAPEYKYPAAPEDCYAATKWVAENAASLNGDPSRVAVGGDSAGGNLSAVVSLMAKEHGGPKLVFQLLIYPATDYYLPGTPSITENGEGYFLTRDSMVWFSNHYLPENFDRYDPYTFPLHAQDVSGLPPAFVVTAEYDPLRDEGELYAQRLKDAGVRVQQKRYNGMIHGFISMAGVMDQGKQLLADCGAALRSAFA